MSYAPGLAAKFVVPPCDQKMFDRNVNNCLSYFNTTMEISGYQDVCPWPTVKRYILIILRTYINVEWCVINKKNECFCAIEPMHVLHELNSK